MRGKLTTKTIIISIIALLVLGAAITATVLFLKDSGEAAATGKVQNATETEIIQGEEKNIQLNIDENIQDVEQNTENNQIVEENENITETDDNNATERNNNQVNQTRDENQEEPAPTTIEREKIITETILGWKNIGLNSEIGANNLEINYNNLEYKVEYYFDGVLDEETSYIIGGNSKGKVIDSYEEKIKIGYKLDKVENLPLTVTENEDDNVIKVSYTKDETQTKELKYTVKYYLDNVEQEKDTQEVTETVWVNEEETMKFDTTLLNKEYIGYKRVKTNPEIIGTTVENKSEINVYYEKDKNQTKELKYTVKYYLDNVEQEKDTQEVTETVWINEEEIMKFDIKLLNKKYTGYKRVKTNPEIIGTTVENKSEINVYYEKESYGYTIYYYKDTIAGENLLGRIPGTAKFETKITADTTKFIPKEGYVFEGIAPSMTICDDSTKNILNVVYKKVDNLSYTINYLEKGTNKELKAPETVPNQEFNKIIKVSDLEIPNKIIVNSKEYTYSNKFTTAQESYIPGQIIIGTDLSLNVINLYYERPEIKTEKTSAITTSTTQSGKAYPGDVITYTIKVWNEGSGAKQVKIEDNQPSGTTILPNSENKNSGKVLVKSGIVTWIVDVPENTSKEMAKILTFNVKINDDATGTIKNTANVDGKTGPNDGDGYDIIKPAKIIVSKESKVLNKTTSIAEYGDTIEYKIKAQNQGDDVGNVIIKDKDLKESINGKLVEFIGKTGYSGTNQELIDELSENGVSLTVPGGNTLEIKYTVRVIAVAGTKIKNKIETTSGGTVDKDKEETTNEVEKTVAITENTETIKGKNIVIVIDLSASMNDIINGTSKLEAAKDAAQQFITKIFEKDSNGESGTKVSLVTFNFSEEEKDNYRTETNKKYVGTKVFTYGNNKTVVTNKSDAQEINSEIEKIELESNLGTNMGAALIEAEKQINILKNSNKNNSNVIIFLGDGNPEAGGTENTETAINKKATQIKTAGTEIYTIGFGLQQEIEQYCCYSGLLSEFDCELNIPKSEHTTSKFAWTTRYYHKTMVYEEDAIRILRNMASGNTSIEKNKYAKSSTDAQSLIDTFTAISKSIAISEKHSQSSDGKVKLSDTIYADSNHQIIIKVNGAVDTTLNALPTDATGKVIKEDEKYYLDLTKFNSNANVSITYFSK